MTDERVEMRAFLQRSEVRLSTMHRIGGLFLNGAGLLIVVPVFFRETFIDVVNLTRYHALPWSQIPLLLLILITVAVPAISLFFLLRDLVDFYFVGQFPAPNSHTPGHSFNLRFVLSALTLPSASADLSAPDSTKSKVIEEQKNDPGTLRFVLPYLRNYPEHYKRMLDESAGAIIPPMRRAVCENDENLSYLYAAFGLAGVVDRTLAGEVARIEASMVRHALALRRLVLRYIKALLVLLWTIGVFIVSSKWVSVAPHVVGINDIPDVRVTLSLAVGFFVWSAITPIVIRFPVRWIHANEPKKREIDGAFRDRELISFELRVIVLSVCAFAIASVLLAVSLSDALHLDAKLYAGLAGVVVGIANGAYWLYRIRRAVVGK